MTIKEKARTDANGAGQQEKTSNRNSIPSGPLQGWFNLAKPSRNRQQQRGCQKGARK